MHAYERNSGVDGDLEWRRLYTGGRSFSDVNIGGLMTLGNVHCASANRRRVADELIIPFDFDALAQQAWRKKGLAEAGGGPTASMFVVSRRGDACGLQMRRQQYDLVILESRDGRHAGECVKESDVLARAKLYGIVFCYSR